MRNAARGALVGSARARLQSQLARRGADGAAMASALRVLDPEVLTLGFARRFAEYKRPTLLLADRERLTRLLCDPARPVQIVVAGKAHPADEQGKRMIEAWLDFVKRPEVRHRAVFLEDYDLELAEEMVQGVDLWINTPRRPMEACGTSGMKVLVNGGLNLSTLDGWWAEAYSPEVGWALGDGYEGTDADARDAEELYALLERSVAPEFYDRGDDGVPRRWCALMRASMTRLAPAFSSNRMASDYVGGWYRPAVAAVRARLAQRARLGRALDAWQRALDTHWAQIQLRVVRLVADGGRVVVEVAARLGEVDASAVRVEVYSEPLAGGATVATLERLGERDADGWVRYGATIESRRPATDFTPRIVPRHPQACVPMELPLIVWP
jgi:glycogen phosphorylase